MKKATLIVKITFLDSGDGLTDDSIHRELLAMEIHHNSTQRSRVHFEVGQIKEVK